MSGLSEKFIDDSNPQELRNEKHTASFVSSIITKVGNFGVQMNYQAISIALIVMSKSVCTTSEEDCKNGDQEPWVHSSATAAVFAGSIFGQLTMGYAGDVFGRTNAMGLTQGIAIISALFSAILPTGSADQIYSTIIACRFFLGIGLGGVYPLAATKAAEDSASGGHTNPAAAASSFFWQTPGSFAPWIIALIFTSIDSLSTNMRWRLLLGLGVIPCSIVLVGVFIENRQTYQRTHTTSVDGREIVRKASFVAEEVKHDKHLWLKLIGTGKHTTPPPPHSTFSLLIA
jgi:MFS family permease